MSSRGVILLYHRISDVRPDPWGLAVTPQHFAEHLDVLSRRGMASPLRQLANLLLDNRFPHRSVALTFDDGYADNLHNAKPLLERHDVPATVFLTAGFVGGTREFWWDELERVLLQPGELPDVLQLRVGGTDHRWQLAEAARYSVAAAERHRSWQPAAGTTDPTPRQYIYRSLYALLQPLPAGAQRRVLDDVLRWASAEAVVRSTHRTLSREEVSLLAGGGLIEIGAHTVTHPLLAALPAVSQLDEIRHGKTRVEEMCGSVVTGFAYPYGGPAAFTAETVAMVRDAGFAYACSAFYQSVGSSSDRYQLPRIAVPDCDGDEFARQLARWFRA